ncbi:hypothetical protein S40293_03795 [Stachybotrys chartarum IBT 40293]|nr:hypothetical protein S40293_03795 [Stachybotrys chartarum IBT 40293]
MGACKATPWLIATNVLFGAVAGYEIETGIEKTTTPLVGLIGFGIDMYEPLCGAACHDILWRAELSCSTPNPTGSPGYIRHNPSSGRPIQDFLTSASCFATDVSYLTSTAYCFDQYCGAGADNIPVWQLEKAWRKYVASGEEPQWTYGEALRQSQEALQDAEPRLWEDGLLNYTAILDAERYDAVYGSFKTYKYAETSHARYGIITLVLGAGVPILLTLAGYLPWGSTIGHWLEPYLSASIYKGYNMRILPFWLGNAATVGQALYVFSFFSLNFIVSAVDYHYHWPHRMYESRNIEPLYYLANRTGVLAFAIAPLVILLASRNNILLWLSNWSHGTFIVLHRWVGRVFVIQSIVHSIIELHIYVIRGRYPHEETKSYWIWGAVATVAAVAILVSGITWARRTHYELFLISHIVLTIFVLIGSWYHVQLLYFGARGYENWLYACFAVWGADRLLRLLRIAKTGIRISKVTELSDELVRVDIEGVRWDISPGTHAYAYFPGLNWRVWENHPFSVVSTARIQRSRQAKTAGGDTPDSSSTASRDNAFRIEKSVGITARGLDCKKTMTTTAGVTLYIKKSRGMTSSLRQSRELTTLLEGPYKDRSHEGLMKCDRLVCLAGGVGITGVLEFAATHPNSKLYWSMKDSDAPLAQDLEGVINSMDEARVEVGQRFNVADILDSESEAGYKTVGVMVCGPEGLCDDTRALVTRMGRHRENVSYELAVEAFSW